jgi:phosphotransferase system enzyme I (PtsI)
MKERSSDVKDITKRIVGHLCNVSSNDVLTEPVILVADDLSPSETVVLDKSKILAFVTVHGATNSHTAILARTMNIPALIGVDMDLATLASGMEAAVDGFAEEFIVEPDEKSKSRLLVRIEEEEKQKELLQDLKGKENITLSGKKINLYANIGCTEDLKYVKENDAGGIGLFRSEFLYIGKDHLPGEEEQFRIYKKAAEEMDGKKVIIRTLDIGADKQVDYFNMEHEENPAMGYRAIRICLDRIEVFKTQLRALYRVSAFGTISIMFPMIISVNEVLKIKEICKEVQAELDAAHMEYGEVELGIMIETPAAVMVSDELAKEVDFFSIGTNDLTQYTLAIDRQNAKLDSIYDAHHPAVLKMIEMTIENGHKHGCWVGICGELGADLELTEKFIKMGIDELSVSPNMVLPIRKAIRETKYDS